MAALTKARVFFYGMTPEAELWADDIQSFGLEGISFSAHYHGETLHLNVPLIGQHSVQTSLRAIAAGLALGLTWEEIISGLQNSRNQLRLVAVHTEQGALILMIHIILTRIHPGLWDFFRDPGRHIAVLAHVRAGQYEKHGMRWSASRTPRCGRLITLGANGKMTPTLLCAPAASQKIVNYETRQVVERCGHLQKGMWSC